MVKTADVDRIIVDTAVMPKAIANPTDGRLLEKSRQHLLKKSGDGHAQGVGHPYDSHTKR